MKIRLPEIKKVLINSIDREIRFCEADYNHEKGVISAQQHVDVVELTFVCGEVIRRRIVDSYIISVPFSAYNKKMDSNYFQQFAERMTRELNRDYYETNPRNYLKNSYKGKRKVTFLSFGE